jgi:GrpB-like predicted nucleotidyltransferase (UPF0157 family)
MILAPYNPAWPVEFAALRDVYATALGSLILRIEHVGSTAVPHLHAKPILDIDIVMQDYEIFPQIVEGLGRLGYRHNGDQGVLHREAFKPVDRAAPYTSPRRVWREHHLYVCPVESAELQRHLLFRDALRARADWRQEYEQRKREIADRADGDRKTYARIKEVACRAFIERILSEASDHALRVLAQGKVSVEDDH